MFASDPFLFHLDLTERLKKCQESKCLWLELVKIAVHDFTIIHKRTHCQQVVTDFFTSPLANQGTDMSQ
eukprot:13565986-Ditylum_brightwellii.AAC.1